MLFPIPYVCIRALAALRVQNLQGFLRNLAIATSRDRFREMFFPACPALPFIPPLLHLPRRPSSVNNLCSHPYTLSLKRFQNSQGGSFLVRVGVTECQCARPSSLLHTSGSSAQRGASTRPSPAFPLPPPPRRWKSCSRTASLSAPQVVEVEPRAAARVAPPRLQPRVELLGLLPVQLGASARGTRRARLSRALRGGAKPHASLHARPLIKPPPFPQPT